MKKIGYIRASLKEEVEEQSESLIAAGCSKIYVEPVNNFNPDYALEKVHS